MNKPIKPGAHGVIGYGFLAVNLPGPSALGLKGAAGTLSYLFGGIAGGLNAVTDQPLALRRIVPFRTHGTMGLSSLPLFVLLPWLTGAAGDPKARNYFLFLSAALATVYSLTDWNATPGR